MRSLKATWIRGGTSKGLFFNEDDFPYPRGSPKRDEVVRNCLGFGGNGLQLDGVGGGLSSTSKVAFVGGRSSAPTGCQLTYDFGQVNNQTGSIDWKGNCGNLASGLVLFARMEKLLDSPLAASSARVWQVNVQQEMRVTHLPHEPKLELAGIGGGGGQEPILVEFAPDASRAVLPTGNVVDLIGNSNTLCTLVLGSNPTVFVANREEEASAEWIEELRQEGARRMGVECNDAVRVAFVGRPPSASDAADIQVRITVPPGSSRVFHHAITGTGAANLAIAARIPGTICHQIVSSSSSSPSRELVIGHPSGTMRIGAQVEKTNNQWYSRGVSFLRTARVLMCGRVFY